MELKKKEKHSGMKGIEYDSIEEIEWTEGVRSH